MSLLHVGIADGYKSILGSKRRACKLPAPPRSISTYMYAYVHMCVQFMYIHTSTDRQIDR